MILNLGAKKFKEESGIHIDSFADQYEKRTIHVPRSDMSHLDNELLDNKTMRSKSALSKSIKPSENAEKSPDTALNNKKSNNAKSTKTLPEPVPQPTDTNSRGGVKSAKKPSKK